MNCLHRLLKLGLLFIFSCLVIFPTGANANDESSIQTIQIFFENDLFGNTDKYYTNAVQLTWLSKDFEEYRKADNGKNHPLPDWTLPIIETLPFAKQKNVMRNVGLILGQQIYTPSDIQDQQLIEDDRPYAGFLYGGIALHSKATDPVTHIDKLDTIEIVLGMVGPSSLGEFAQNSIHEIRDLKTAKGWDNQLKNEPGLRFSWQRKWRFWEDHPFDLLDSDLITHTGMTLGNVRTSVNIGGELRFGYRIPRDFGSDCIRPGAGVSAPINKTLLDTNQFGFHLFASTQAEFVARDIFLDGNTWCDSHDVDKEHLVADISLGFALNYKTYKLTYRHLFRTRQFEHQEQGHVIGSLTLTLSF